MKSSLLFLSIVFFSIEFTFAQNLNTISSKPDWITYMQSDNPNLITLRDLFDAYYAENDFVKNRYTQDFKRLMKEHWIEKDENGFIQKNVKYPSVSESKSANSPWEEIGPWDYDHEQAMIFEVQSPGATHVYTVEQSPINPDLIVAGTATAGLWKSTDKGLNWVLLTRELDVNSVYSIALDPADEDIIFFGEGNGDIWKTIDGGLNWFKTGSLSFQSTSYFCRDLKFIGANTLLAATNMGLFRSNNGGLDWVSVQGGEHMEIEIQPGNASTLYTVRLSANKTQFYKSLDNGLTWTLKPSGWPNPLAGDEQKRCEISVSNADPNIVYVLASGIVGPDEGLYGIYKSIDAGESFTFECCNGSPVGTPTVSNPNTLGWSNDGTGDGGQIYYDLSMGASPTNSNKLFTGGINVWRSEDAGSSWQLNSHWVTWVDNLKHRYNHADVHDIKFFENGSQVDMWVASDGGLYYSSDQGDNLEPRMHGMHGTDFWGFDAGFKNGYAMVGGTYHNGTIIRYDDIYKGGLTDPNTGGWLAELGGDNYRGFVNYGNQKVGYHDGGSFNFSEIRSERITSRSFQSDKKCNTSYVTGEYGNYGFDPMNYNHFYSPVDSKLFETNNGGVSFTELHDFGGAKVIQVKVGWTNPNYIYVTHKYSNSVFKIWKSIDKGQNWTEITPTSSETGNNQNRVKYIEVDDEDPSKLWCILMGSQTGNKVFKSIDGGLNWTNITTASIQAENVISISHHYGTDDGLYIGTKKRIYYKNNSMADWELFNTDLPASVACNFIVPYYGEGKIRTATQRGVYQCDFYEDVAPVALFAAEATEINYSANCTEDSIRFVDHSTVRHNTATWQWFFEGGNPSTSTLENPVVTYATPGVYDVKLIVTDAFGIDSIEIADFITITNAPNSPNIYEEFSGTEFPPNNWKLIDSEGSSWEKDYPENDLTNGVASYPNYWVNSTNETHLLVTPAVDLTNALWYSIAWDYTYHDNNSYKDTLAVLYRTGTNSTWQTIWIKGGADLRVPATDVWFWYDANPTVSWNSELIDLSFLVGEDCVEFAFDNRGENGNHIWIDNVNLYGDHLGIEYKSNENVTIFPNPSSGHFTSKSNSTIEGYTITDMYGKIILQEKINPTKLFDFNISNQPNGVYFVQFEGASNIKPVQIVKL